MTERYSHLSDSARAVVDRSNDERLAFIDRPNFILFDRPLGVLAELERLVTYPVQTRMPCVLIWGPTGIGKTKTVEAFLKRHPAVEVTSNGLRRRVQAALAIQMPAEPDHQGLLECILNALGWYGFRYRRTRDLQDIVYRLLRETCVRALLVDEFHNLNCGTSRQRQIILNCLKNLSNELQVSIVAVGTEEAKVVIQYDSQMASRFDALEMRAFRQDASYHTFLRTFVANLPLREASNVDSKDARRHLLGITNGITVNLMRLLRQLAINAIVSGSERIVVEPDTLATAPLLSMKGKARIVAERER